MSSRRYNRLTSLQAVQDASVAEGDCWLWRGYTTSNGIPYGYMGGQRLPVRRIVWLLQLKPAQRLADLLRDGVPPAGPVLYSTHCGEPMCVNPDHVRVTTRQQALARTRRTGAINNTKRRQSIAAAWRRRPDIKLTPELARAIRSSDKSALQLSRELGLNHETVSKVRRGELWAEIVASPWAGMGARRA